MRKKIIALVAVAFVFVIFLTAVPLILTVLRPPIFPYDQFFDDGKHPMMCNYSPMPPIHTNPTFDVSFDYATPINWMTIISFSCSLNETVHTLVSTSWSDFTYHVYHVFGTLRDLPNGYFEVSVFANYVNGTSEEIDRYHFIVNPDYKEPTLRVISPLNQTTYHTNSIQLNYTIDSKVIWSYYAVDSHANINDWIPFKGNITIADLSEGSHKIVVSVQTEASRLSEHHPISFETIYFAMDTTDVP
jgi:hypothetical protein